MLGRVSTLAAVGLFLLIAAALGQEGAVGEPESEPTEAAAAGGDAAAASFSARLEELREVVKQLRARQVEWLAATAQNRKALEEAYFELAEKSDALVREVQAAAEAAFSADPKNAEAAAFLGQVIRLRNMVEDDFEPAFNVAKLMIDNDIEDPELLALGGHAAYAVGEFKLAKEWLALAKEKKALTPEGERYLDNIDFYIDAWKKEQEIREAEAAADDLPRVLIKTNRGDITVELFENEAPNTVANFVSLVEKKFYDGLTFHRVLPGFMAQGGDPNGDGTGGPGYQIPCECDEENHRLHFRGNLSMAHAGPDTGGSQFFLMFVPSGPAAGYDLNGKHTVFGRVIEGIDVLARIKRRDPEKDSPPRPDRIIEARVVRKRNHAYEPMTTPES
jgi:cyclophilin family peptidyl-prolyl cis-trans isomerase